MLEVVALLASVTVALIVVVGNGDWTNQYDPTAVGETTVDCTVRQVLFVTGIAVYPVTLLNGRSLGAFTVSVFVPPVDLLQ